MPAPKRPTPDDTVTARRILLDGVTRDADIFDLAGELAPLHPRHNTFPGEVLPAPGRRRARLVRRQPRRPLSLEGSRDRFLPECAFRGRQDKKLQYAVLTAAALHGGTEPDLLDEIAWWQTDDFWQYALFPTIAYIRAAANRANAPSPRHARNSPSARARRQAEPGHILQLPATEGLAMRVARGRHQAAVSRP
jgi:hypothetical protein